MFGQTQQQRHINTSFNTSVESALGNINSIMNHYNQHGSSNIPRRPKGRQRSRSAPYTQVRPSKRKVVQLLQRKKLSNGGKLQQPYSYKDFEEIWEGNLEYTDQTSESDILKYICSSFNSQSSENKSVVGVTDMKMSQLKFVHRENGKLTTRESVKYDVAGIQCNYRQGTVYLIYQNEDKNLLSVQTNLESFLCVSVFICIFSEG